MVENKLLCVYRGREQSKMVYLRKSSHMHRNSGEPRAVQFPLNKMMFAEANIAAEKFMLESTDDKLESWRFDLFMYLFCFIYLCILLLFNPCLIRNRKESA